VRTGERDFFVLEDNVRTLGSIGTETKLSLSYHQLDPSAVTKEDIIGGYEAATGKYTGIELISQVYPKLGITPGLIVCPGWSHIVAVGTAMTAKTTGLNGVFKCMAVKDIPTADVVEYSACNEWKSKNAYTDKHDIVCWPKVVVGDYQLYFSAVLAALIAYTDNENGGVPYVSPSNKQFRITGTVLADGTEVYLDQLQANILNGQGIVTAINIAGTWKCWGNNTGIYPVSTDVKDRFMPCRRMFVWWGNTFIQTYFQKVDDPMNKRLIEAIVDSENIRANGYKAKFQLADARIVYIPDENPTTDLLNGKIVFHQYLTPFPPAETIIDILEFDPDAFTASLS
jgi:phage tail sheath protein FI